MQKHKYGIGELAREFSITARAIRFYEDKGLLRPARRGQTRIYSHQDKVLLRLILRGKRIGFSLEEVGQIFALYEPYGDNVKQFEQLLAKVEQKRECLRLQEQDIAEMRKELDKVEQRVLAAVDQPKN